MKNIMKRFLLFALPAVLLAACNNEEGLNSTATPRVKYIRSTDPALAEIYLTSASMGELIAIIGDGLEGVCSVRFNDVEAKLNPTYITSTAVLVNVPGTLPTEITNTITLTTKKGRSCVVENFITKAPSPVINSVSCEWTRPGEALAIHGNYFFDKADGSPIECTIGGIEAAVTACTATRLDVTVPDGVDATAKQRIVLANDNGEARSAFYLYDRDNIFIDFEELNDQGLPVWDNWGRCKDDIHSENGIDGNYMLMTGKAADWGWDENLSLFFCNILNEAGDLRRELIPEQADIADYVLKFEIRADAWDDLYMAMWFSDLYNSFSVDGTEPQCHWRGYSLGLETGVWTTATVPLSEFCYGKSEDESRTLTASLVRNFCIFFFGALDDSANADTPISIALDNFRVVKKQ